MFFLPVTFPIDFVPTNSVKPPFGNCFVALVLPLVLPSENATPEGRVGIEGDVVIPETRYELLLHLPKSVYIIFIIRQEDQEYLVIVLYIPWYTLGLTQLLTCK